MQNLDSDLLLTFESTVVQLTKDVETKFSELVKELGSLHLVEVVK